MNSPPLTDIFDGVLSHTSQSIFWQNKDLVNSGCNKNFALATGLKNPEDIVGKTIYELPLQKKDADFFYESSKKAMFKRMESFSAGKKIFILGKEEYLDIQFIPIFDRENNTNGILCVWDNVTERHAAEKKMEKKILRADKLVALGEMTAGIAHELNQPLSILNVLAEGLLDRFSDEKKDRVAHQSSKKMMVQVKRLHSIAENVNSFVRKNSNAMDFIDIKEPVNSALSFFKDQFRINEIDLDLDFEERMPLVTMDPQKFGQIVVNLLNNACFAVNEKSKNAEDDYQKKISITLLFDQERQFVVFEITDNGIGMGKEVLANCMKPFYTTKEAESGMGIGLSITRKIATEFKMKVEIESAEGEWTKFRFLTRPSRYEIEKKTATG